MIMYAQSKGTGTCLWGGGRGMHDRNRTARKRLGLKKHEHILEALQVGYPDVTFRNKIERKMVRWIGDP